MLRSRRDGAQRAAPLHLLICGIDLASRGKITGQIMSAPNTFESGGTPVACSGATGAAGAAASSRAGYFRWVICTLLLLGVTKNYMDRQVLGLLKPTLQQDLGWNEIDYSNLVFAFQAARALGMVVVRTIDG